MSKKMGLVDGIVVGGGFFLGYFLVKWLVAFLFIITVIWGTCALVSKNEARGRTDPITHSLLKVGDYSKYPMLVFTKNCPLRTSPSVNTPPTDSTVAGNMYRVINKKNGWKQIITNSNIKLWTRCPTKGLQKGGTHKKHNINKSDMN